jgi:hypothetical protein
MYADHIQVVFNGRVDADSAAQALDQCGGDLTTAVDALSEIYGQPSRLFHTAHSSHGESEWLGGEGAINMSGTGTSTTESRDAEEVVDGEGLMSVENVVRSLLVGIIPSSLIDPFLHANCLVATSHQAKHVYISVSRAKFIVEQVLLIVDACSLAEEVGAVTGLGHLLDIVTQPDAEGRPLDWLLDKDNMEKYTADTSGVLYSLLQLGGDSDDENESAPVARFPSPELAYGAGDEGVVQTIRSALLQTLATGSGEGSMVKGGKREVPLLLEACSQISDDIILQCLDACEGNVDCTVAVLHGTILNGEWVASAQSSSSARASGRRKLNAHGE